LRKNKLYGALLGDITGSIYEFNPIPYYEYPLNIHDERGHITDDSLLTIAMADSIINNKDTVDCLKEWSKEYNIPDNKLGFGLRYLDWIYSNSTNDSWGNGALMRISPFMWTNNLIGAINSTKGSHEHYQSIVSIVELYKLYNNPRVFKDRYINTFEDLDESCKGTIKFVKFVWEKYVNFSTQELILETIRYNGDCDTNASILGELSNYHKNDLTQKDIDYVNSKLDRKQLSIIEKFNKLSNRNKK